MTQSTDQKVEGSSGLDQKVEGSSGRDQVDCGVREGERVSLHDVFAAADAAWLSSSAIWPAVPPGGCR